MAIDLYWYDEAESVMIIGFRPGWNWQDYEEGLRKGPVMWQGKTHRIDFILDFTHPYAQFLPKGSGFHIIRRGAAIQPTHPGISIWAGQSRMIFAMLEVYRKVYNRSDLKIPYYDTVEEAYQYILQLRAGGDNVSPHMAE